MLKYIDKYLGKRELTDLDSAPVLRDSTLAMLPLNKRLTRIALLILIAISLAALYVARGGQITLPSFFVPIVKDHSNDVLYTPNLYQCSTFPRRLLDKVQPVLKMGHGESRAKVEGQLESVSACFGADELLFYSDLDERILGRQVVDILANLSDSYLVDNDDFQNYILQKELHTSWRLDVGGKAAERVNGWILDKYKFMPMIEHAWQTKPDRDFYFFYETDTYVFWDNVLLFLERLNPDEALYMGSPSPGREMVPDDPDNNDKIWFANGGPGFALSRGAVKALLFQGVDGDGKPDKRPPSERYLPDLRGDCCGDSVLGWELWQMDIPLQGYWPLFNPHPMHSVPYSDLYWCQPLLTLHKTKPEDMRPLWNWEADQRPLQRPLLYEDLWEFRRPGQTPTLDDWDNGAWDGWDAPPDADINSFEACGKYCRGHKDCVQWSWRGGDEQKCIAMRSIRYGEAWQKPRDATSGPLEVRAGWVTERVSQWRKEKKCAEPDWVGPSLTRIF